MSASESFAFQPLTGADVLDELDTGDFLELSASGWSITQILSF
tara:strand:- start:1930 stop:2058 length:129 start_codon:yes stop_codon:yes gene_type:complete